MYLDTTPVSTKGLSDTENHVTTLKQTREAGWAMREVSNKYTVGLANIPMLTTGT